MPVAPPQIVDLHCHSFASTGASGLPPHIPGFFKQRGYAACSLTEHDSVTSLDAARTAADEVGIEYLPGVEVSARVDDPELAETGAHILGYGFEVGPALTALLDEAGSVRREWVRGGLARLRQQGLADIREEELAAHLRKVLGPDHIWKEPLNIIPLDEVLRAKGAFTGPGNAARLLLDEVYPRDELPVVLPTAAKVCNVLRQAGAVVILAHPGAGGRPCSPHERRRLEHWLDHYVDGLEVYTPKHGADYRAFEMQLLGERQRPFSGGTDSHVYSADTAVSQAPYACVESIRAWQQDPVPTMDQQHA